MTKGLRVGEFTNQLLVQLGAGEYAYLQERATTADVSMGACIRHAVRMLQVLETTPGLLELVSTTVRASLPSKVQHDPL